MNSSDIEKFKASNQLGASFYVIKIPVSLYGFKMIFKYGLFGYIIRENNEGFLVKHSTKETGGWYSWADHSQVKYLRFFDQMGPNAPIFKFLCKVGIHNYWYGKWKFFESKNRNIKFCCRCHRLARLEMLDE